MARRGDESEPEAFEIVEGVVEGVDLKLAAIARAGIDLADGEAAAETAPRGRVEVSCKRRHLRVGRRQRLGEGGAGEALEEELAHGT